MLVLIHDSHNEWMWPGGLFTEINHHLQQRSVGSIRQVRGQACVPGQKIHLYSLQLQHIPIDNFCCFE